MSELGSSAAVGIESVDWLDAGGGQLTVRVTGRWRRRRGWVESRGPTMLVIEAEGRRHRFPATPEPPSLGGAAPGTWRLSFSVPAELAHGLSGHVWLALGTVTVPLPVPESAAGSPAEPAEPATGPPAAGPSPEPATGPPPEPATGPPGEPATPVTGAPGESEPSTGPPATGSPAEPVAAKEADDDSVSGETGSPDVASERDPGGLEIERAWRRADMAERVAGELGERVTALERALERERAERAVQTTPPETIAPAGAEAERLRAEDALRAARRGADVRVPAEPAWAPVAPGSPPAGPATAIPAQPDAATAAMDSAQGRPAGLDMVAALHRELSARVAAEAALRARTVQAETRLAARVLLEQRTTAALGELRGELERLREALESERARRHNAEAAATQLRAELGGQRERSRDAYTAIQELRSAIESLRPPTAEPAAGEMGGAGGQGAAPGASGETVAPDRLTDALARLRQNAPAQDGGEEPTAAVPSTALAPLPATSSFPVAVGCPTVEQPFRVLAARDAERAGWLLLGLLGAQQAAWPHAIAYDLVLGPGYGTVQVTVGERGVSVQRAAAPRGREQVAFQITGAPARLARLFNAGPLRRLLRIGLARVRGRREGIDALRALLGLPLDLAGLRSAGVSLEAETLFTLLAAMIEPSWTQGERFTISHTDERGRAVFLEIRDGAPSRVSLEPPAGRIATELEGPVEALWRAFADGAPMVHSDAGLAVRGDQGPLTLVRTWANRAQSGHGAR